MMIIETSTYFDFTASSAWKIYRPEIRRPGFSLIARTFRSMSIQHAPTPSYSILSAVLEQSFMLLGSAPLETIPTFFSLYDCYQWPPYLFYMWRYNLTS
jgi:hypothetical protein